MAKTKVQLTIHQPGHLHEVEEDEIESLRAQGLLVEDEASASPAAPAAAKSAPKE